MGSEPGLAHRRGGGTGWRLRLPEHASRRHRAAFVVSLIVLWEALVRGGVFDRRFVAPPTEVTVGFWHIVRDPDVLRSVQETATATGYAVALAAAVGIAAGCALGLSPFLDRTFKPVANVMFAWPKMVMTPFFVLFFGFGISSKAIFAFTLGVFPLLFNVVEGVKSAPPVLRTAVRSMGASRVQTLLTVVAPSAVPSVLRGVRLGVTYCLLGVILAELYGATSGVGVYLEHFTLRLQRDRLFALFFLVGLLAILTNLLLSRVEARLQEWRG